MKYNYSIPFVLALSMLFTSCGPDSRKVSQDELFGRWEMVSAKRNGEATNTLDKSFFNITKDRFSHNLDGDSTALDYKFTDNEIVLNDEMLENLNIVDLHNDTLVAKTKIGTYRFEFTMTKNEAD